MKKLIYILIFLVLVTGCGKKQKSFHYSSLKRGIEMLTFDTLDYEHMIYQVEEKEQLNELKTISKEEIEEKLGLKETDYQQVILRVSKDAKNFMMYLLIEPSKGSETLVREHVQTYFESLESQEENEEIKKKYKERKELEYLGSFIYVVADDASMLLSKIKEEKKLVFPSMNVIQSDDTKQMIGINSTDLESEFLFHASTLENPDTLFIIKPKKEKEAEVKKKLNQYFKNLEKTWDSLDQKKADLVKNRLETELEDHLIYIISSDNEMVLKMLEQYYE